MEIEGGVVMSQIDANVKQLNDAAEKIYSSLYAKGCLMSVGNDIKTQMDNLSKVWKSKENFEHLNSLGKIFNEYRSFLELLECYRKIIYDAATEYDSAGRKAIDEANKV